MAVNAVSRIVEAVGSKVGIGILFIQGHMGFKSLCS